MAWWDDLQEGDRAADAYREDRWGDRRMSGSGAATSLAQGSREAAGAVSGLASGQLRGALAGRAPSVGAAEMAGQIAAQRQALAGAAALSPAQQRLALLGGGQQALAQNAELAARAGQEQWGALGQGAQTFGALSDADVARAMSIGREEAARRAADEQRRAARGGILNQIIGGAAMGFGTLLAKSDSRAKSGIAPADAEADAALASLRPVRFAYRGEPEDEPAHLGVIAQDVERGGPMGQSMVERDEDGMRMLVGDRVMPAVFDMLDRLNQRIDAVANGKRGNRGGSGQPPPPPLPVPPPRPMEG